MINDETQDAARAIGQFFSQRIEDDYRNLTYLIRKFDINVHLPDKKVAVIRATEKMLVDLRITKIEVVNNEVTITTGRPGMIIGKRGETIDSLETYLGKKVKIVEAEDNILDYLVPFQPEDLENL